MRIRQRIRARFACHAGLDIGVSSNVVLACTVGTPTDIQTLRVRRLADLIEARFGGNKTALARVLGHHDGSTVRKMLAGRMAISEKSMLRIEAATGLGGWFSLSPNVDARADRNAASEPSNIVRVLGSTTTGPDARQGDSSPWSLSDGERYVEAFVETALGSSQPYALRVDGQGLSPRSRDGEWLVVAPGAAPAAGDDVVLKSLAGEVSVCQVAALYDEHVVLIDLSPTLARTTRRWDELVFMHPVGLQLPARRGMRHIDRPGYRGPDRRVMQIAVEVDRRRG